MTVAVPQTNTAKLDIVVGWPKRAATGARHPCSTSGSCPSPAAPWQSRPPTTPSSPPPKECPLPTIGRPDTTPRPRSPAHPPLRSRADPGLPESGVGVATTSRARLSISVPTRPVNRSVCGASGGPPPPVSLGGVGRRAGGTQSLGHVIRGGDPPQRCHRRRCPRRVATLIAGYERLTGRSAVDPEAIRALLAA